MLLGRDSWMRFNSRTFSTLPRPGPDGRVMGELTLSTRFSAGACVYATHDEAPESSFHLKYAGSSGISLGPEPTLIEVNLVRSSGLPALIGEYLVSFRPEVGALSSPDAFVSNGLQRIPLAGCAELEPGAILGTAAAPLLRVPVETLTKSFTSSTSSTSSTSPSSNSSAPSPSTTASRVNTVDPNPEARQPSNPPPAPPPPKPPPQELMDRLSEAQRSSFSRLWDRLPSHMHAIAFDLHDPGWSPEAIDRLADALCDYSDVFSTSKTDFGACDVLPFSLSVPPGTKPVASRPYRINPLMQKKVDAVLDQYLAAGLIQHSTSPWASPLVVIPKKDGSVRITVNYKRLNALVDLDGQPLPRVDGILDSLYTGKVFSIFDLNSAFHQIVCDKETVPLTAFCTPTQLFEWLRMPQGANASPSWFVKVINRVVQGLDRVLAYLDDVICFDEEPLEHVRNMIEFFKRLRQYNLKLSPGKARVGATHANFLGHTISPAGVSPDGDKVRALTKMPPPANVKLLRSLLGGLSYYRKFLKNLASKVRPLNALLKQGVQFKYTPSMITMVKSLLHDLSRPPILVFPDWDAVEDNSRPLRLCSDACIDGFGASLEQEQSDGTVRPIVYISRATLPAERNWTVLDLEAGSIVWAIKRLRGYLWSTKFVIYSDHKALESIGKVGEHNARVQRWLEYLSNFTYTLEYRKGSANGNADFLSRLPLPAREEDKTGPDSIDGIDQAGVFLIRACGFTYHSSSTPEVGLGGLRPPCSDGVFPPSVLEDSDNGDFRRHGPRMDELASSPPAGDNCRSSSGVFAVSPASGDTVPVSPSPFVPIKSHWARRHVHVLSSLPEQGPLVSSRTRAKTSAASGSPVAGPTYFRRQPRATVVPRASSPARRPSRSRQMAKTAGTGPRLSRTPATPTSAPSSTVSVPPVISPSSATPSSPVSSSSRSSPGTADFSASSSAGSSGDSFDPTADDSSYLQDCVQSFNTVDWAREQQRESECIVAMRFLSRGSPSPPPSGLLNVPAPLRSPTLTDVLALASKTRLHTTDDNITLLVHKSAPRPVGRAGGRTTRLPDTGVPRIYVPMLMRPWVLRACHTTASFHLGVHRTLRLLERFYWWFGMDRSVRWWLRSCLVCQARKISRQTTRWPEIAMPLPQGPGILVGVDFFGPLPVTAKGNSYILLFTDRFSRRADMFAVTAAGFTAKGTANVFVNQYMTKWGCPTTLLSDNGMQFCSKLSMAIYDAMKIKKVTTSAYHPQTNGGTERVNHTMAQMLAVVVNEKQTDWDVHLPHVEFAYNNSVNQATGLAPNEIHMGRIPRLPLSVFDHPTVGGHQSLDRDQLEYCNLAVDRQRRAYDLVREYNALKVSRVERRNSSLLDAINKLPTFIAGGWVWVYNTAATIRRGAKKDTDQQVLKVKFSLPWTGPYKVLAVGPASADDTPDGRPLGSKLLYLDLPSDLSGPDARARVSVLRCKLCRNPYDVNDLPQSLPADLSRYVLHSFGAKCPPFHVTVDDVSPPVGCLEVDYISGHQLVRHRNGIVAVLYQTHWIGLTTPSWERESDLDTFRRHILLYWSNEICQSKQGNRNYRLTRTRAAHRELARSRGERYMPPGFSLVSHETWLRRFSASLLPVGARLWCKARDGLWWNGQIGAHQDGSYVVRLFDDPGPRILPLPAVFYSTALDAACGSWCLEKHRSRPLGDTNVRIPPRADSIPSAVPRISS